MSSWTDRSPLYARLRPTSVVSLAVGLACLAAAPEVSGQLRTEPAVDPEHVRGAARSAQSDFERRRIRYLPVGPPIGSTRCDGTVGRFCWWAEDGEWFPVPEDPRIVEMRADLLITLDSLQGLSPDDDWVLGQRVWYRAESNAWREASEVARACPSRTGWWCAVLEGYALHHGARYVGAERAFAIGLDGMDPEMRHRWTRPRWAVDGGVRDALDDLRDDDAALDAYLEALWTFADPLYLEEGNDRWTGHLARWVATELRRDARNPFRLRWGDDLTELTVRNGWEVGWERSRARDITGPDEAIGRKQPESRDYMPPGELLRWPVEAGRDALIADRTAPRSLYAPAYAPVLLPMSSDVAVFPRGATTVYVVAPTLPDDTTFHALHDHPRPWMEPGEDAGRPPVRGLFAWPIGPTATNPAFVSLESRAPYRTVRTGSDDGPILLEVPTGTYLVSAESHRPAERRAGRVRRVVEERRALDDLATLSDIVLLDPEVSILPSTLEAAVPALLPEARVRRGESLVVAWEVAGLGFRPESLHFELSLERADRGLIGRLGGFLGLSSGPQPVEVAWEEVGPDRPGPMFFALRLDPSGVEAGRYRLKIRLHTGGRTPVEQEREVTVLAEGEV